MLLSVLLLLLLLLCGGGGGGGEGCADSCLSSMPGSFACIKPTQTLTFRKPVARVSATAARWIRGG
jgi:hypothetical protein